MQLQGGAHMNAIPTSKPGSAESLKLFDDPAVQARDPGNLGAPATQQSVSPPGRQKSASKAKSGGRAAPTLVKQAFLPGLSRRGRPRLPNPVSAVQRTAEHRKKRIEEGARRVEMILAPEVAGALDALAAHYHQPRSDVVSGLILKAAARLLRRTRNPQSSGPA